MLLWLLRLLLLLLLLSMLLLLGMRMPCLECSCPVILKREYPHHPLLPLLLPVLFPMLLLLLPLLLRQHTAS